MPQYQYNACTNDGKRTQGSLFASSTADAVSMLSKRGWTATSLRTPAGWLPKWRFVSLNDQVSWYSTLADLLASGMPIASSLELLQDKSTNSMLVEATQDIRSRVVQGESLSQAMKYHPEVFDSLAQHLMAAGEEGNFQDRVLEKIALIKESKSKLISRLTSAFAYPAFLLVVGALVFAGMMLFFVPKFEPLFERMRETDGLPWATELLFSVNHFLSANGLVISLVAVLVPFVIGRWITRPENRSLGDRLLMHNRIIGPLVSGITLSRFCQILGSLLISGVRIQEATIIAGQASGNRVIESAARKAVERITSGVTLADALAEEQVFTKEVVELIRMGEKTNRLEKVLETMSGRLDARNEQKLDIALRMVEPMLMVIMASLIGFVMVALLMPIFNASGQSFQ